MTGQFIHVLLIEDNPDDADLIQNFLSESRAAEFTVEHVERLAAGIELLGAGGIDIILSDLGLPDSQGLTTVARLQTAAPDIPLIMLTGLDDEQTGTEAVRLGAQDYLVKGENDGNLLTRTLSYAIERKQIEQELKRHHEHLEQLVSERTADLKHISRLYQVLSATNQALVYTTDETEFMQNVCRIIVEVGGYPLAWLGFAEHDEAKTVRPVAWAGFDDQYLDSLRITWADTERGHSTIGTAIHTGQPSFVRNIPKRSDIEVWHTNAQASGHAAALALPLIVNDRIIGALNVYSTEPNGFDDQETRLLTEMANDLAYGIETLRVRAEHEQAQEGLRLSAQILDNMGESVFLIRQKDGMIVYTNPRFEQMFEYAPGELLGKHISIINAPTEKSPEETANEIMSALHAHGSWHGDIQNITKNGTHFWCHVRMTPFNHIEHGDVWISVHEDVTDSKQAEKALADRHRELALLNRVIIAATSTLDATQVLEIACRELAFAFGVTQSAAALFNQDRTAATVVAEYLDPEHPNPSALGFTLPVEDNPSMQYVLEHRRPLAVNDTQQGPYVAPIKDLLKERGTASLLILPLTAFGEVIGTIGVDATETRNFTDSEIDLATSVAATVSQALEKARLFTAEHEHRVLAEALADTASALTSTLDLDEVFDRILDNVKHVVPHDASCISLLNSRVARVVRGRGYEQYGLQDIVNSMILPLDTHHNLRQMFDTQEPIIIHDTYTDPQWVWYSDSDQLHSYVGVPILGKESVIGFIHLQSTTRGFFNKFHAEWLEMFAKQAMVAIQNAQLFDAAERRADYLTALNQATRKMSHEGFDLEKVLQAIVTDLVEKLGVTFARVWLPNEHSNALILRASAGIFSRLDGTHSQIPLNDNAHHVSYIARNRQWLISNQVQEDDRFDQDWTAEHELVAFAGYPLVRNQQFIGVLVIFSKSRIDDDLLEVISSFVNQAAATIENARLYQELEAYSEILEQAVEDRTGDLRRATQRVETILNSIGDALMLVRPDGSIEQVNPSFEKQTGYAIHEVELRHYSLLFDITTLSDTLDASKAAIRAGQPWSGEMSIRRKDGTVYIVSMVTAPMQSDNGKVASSVAIMRDITESKRGEEALRQTLEREMEVGEMRMRFLSMASHDLRTPLAVIQSSIELMELYGERLSEEKKRTKFTQIRTSIEHMIELLNDVLTIGRIEAGRLEFSPERMNVEDFCQNTLSSLQMSIGKEHHFDFSATGTCMSQLLDAKLVRHMIQNLISNAVKYSPNGSTVSVALTCEDEQVLLRISDEGIGIPPADLERLFSPFHRAGNVGSVQGTGLGLAIVKQAVELHGGTITCESTEGTGTTFIIRLPQTPDQDHRR